MPRALAPANTDPVPRTELKKLFLGAQTAAAAAHALARLRHLACPVP